MCVLYNQPWWQRLFAARAFFCFLAYEIIDAAAGFLCRFDYRQYPQETVQSPITVHDCWRSSLAGL